MVYKGEKFRRKERGNCGIPIDTIVSVDKVEDGRVYFADKFNEYQSYDIGNLFVYFERVNE